MGKALPKKTLHLTNAYHPASGGISTFYRALLQEANERGRFMRLVVPAEETRVEEVGPCGIIYHIAASPSPVGDSRYRLLLPLFRTGKSIREILRTEQPDVVEIADKYMLHYMAGFLRKQWIPGVRRPVLIGTSHERMDDNVRAYVTGSEAGALFSRLYMRHIYFPMFDCHIANSMYTAGELQPASAGHRPPRGIWTLPMGVDFKGLGPHRRTLEKRNLIVHELGLPPESRMLLYVGRLAQEKNIPLIVETLARLPENYFFLVAGEGSMKAWLEEANRVRLPGRLRFLGHIRDRDRLGDLYANADAFLHPNPREPFGIAPLEAMASGLPLIAPDEGGVLSYANDANAWLARPWGSEFAEAVMSVFADESERQRRTAAARAAAEEHCWRSVAGRFFDLYDELAENASLVPALPPLRAAPKAVSDSE